MASNSEVNGVRHHRENDLEERYHRRVEDIDKVAKYNIVWDRYVKFLVPFLWGGAIWFATKLYPAIAGYPVVLDRLNQADIDRDKMTLSLTILVRMQCLNLDAIDRAKIGLDCTAIPLPTQAELMKLK